jgi:hypothetical protein
MAQDKLQMTHQIFVTTMVALEKQGEFFQEKLEQSKNPYWAEQLKLLEVAIQYCKDAY